MSAVSVTTVMICRWVLRLKIATECNANFLIKKLAKKWLDGVNYFLDFAHFLYLSKEKMRPLRQFFTYCGSV